MTKVRLVVIVGFLLSFGAGASVGLLVSLPESASASRPGRGPDLGAQLNLTAEQKAEMHKIWGEFVMGRDREFRDRKRAIWQEKDESIENLLTDEQHVEYNDICADCTRRLEEIDKQWQDVIDHAVEKTKAILTPEQVKKYEQFRASRQARHSRKGSSRGPGMRSGGFGPGHWRGPSTSTAPADANQADG